MYICIYITIDLPPPIAVVGDNYYSAPPPAPAPEYEGYGSGGYGVPPPAEGGSTTIINEDGGFFGNDEQTIINQSESCLMRDTFTFYLTM